MPKLPAKLPKPDTKAVKPPPEIDTLLKKMKKAKQDTKALAAAHKELQKAANKLESAFSDSESTAEQEHKFSIDVCKVPGPPAPFVPVPLPNIGKKQKVTDGKLKNLKKAQEVHEKAAIKVAMLLGKQSTKLSKDMKGKKGDEAGTLKGLIAATSVGQNKLKSATSKVKMEGGKYKKKIEENRKLVAKEAKILEKKFGKKKR
jgi:hypothetical protein